MSEQLNSKWQISDYFQKNNREIAKEINKYLRTENTIDQSTIMKLIKKFSIDEVTIGKPKPQLPKPTKIPNNNLSITAKEVDGYEITFSVPFTGSKDIFYCSCPRGTIVVYQPDNATIRDNNIEVVVRHTNQDPNEVSSKLEYVLSNYRSNLPCLNAEIKKYNKDLPDTIIPIIEVCKKEQNDLDHFMDSFK